MEKIQKLLEGRTRDNVCEMAMAHHRAIVEKRATQTDYFHLWKNLYHLQLYHPEIAGEIERYRQSGIFDRWLVEEDYKGKEVRRFFERKGTEYVTSQPNRRIRLLDSSSPEEESWRDM